MDYSKQATEFSGGIQELSFDEVDAVNGGIIYLVAAVVVVGGLLYVGWEAAHNRAEQNEG